MNPPPDLSGAHLRTFQTIFKHPVSHNLQWHDVYAMFRQLGQVDEESNGNFKVTLNGQTLVFSPPRKKDISDSDEVMKIRHFLEHNAQPLSTATGVETLWLVEISHHEARIFRSMIHGTVPQQIRPQPVDYATSDSHNFGSLSRGQEKPDTNGFFGLVAKALAESNQFLVFGNGTGTSNEMDQFVEWLKLNHAELAKRIIGTHIVDPHHLTDDQLLAKAREFYAHPRVPTLAKA